MVLDQLDDGAQRLLLVLCLPLVDGVFATLLVSGAIETFSDILTISLTIFTGAGALAVLYSYSESRKEAVNMVKVVSPFLIAGAFLVGLVAPVFEQMFLVGQLEVAAGLALLVIAGEMMGYSLSDRFAVPGIIITGLLLSVDSLSVLTISFGYVFPAVATALVALLALYLACFLNGEILTLEYVRKGGAIVLLIIALTLFGFQIPSEVGLGVLISSLVVAVDYNRLSKETWKILIAT